VILSTAVCLPGLLTQYAWRFVFFAAGRPRSAAANDFVWTFLQFVVFAWLIHSGQHASQFFILGGGVTGTAAAAVGSLQAGLRPDLSGAVAWLRDHRDLASRYVGEVLVVRTALQLSYYTVGITAGLSAVGALRGVTALFGPLNIVYLGLSSALVPEGTRLLQESPDVLARQIRLASAALCAIGVGWSAVLLALPDSAGRALLGSSWTNAAPLLVRAALIAVATGIEVGPWVGLRSLAA